jgi:NhaP-type Na+/H+ or K+/H+ antiporter
VFHFRVFCQESQAVLERALITITPFMAYMIAEGWHFSGVVAILFAGGVPSISCLGPVALATVSSFLGVSQAFPWPTTRHGI